jgi:hypothetical protein
MISASSALTLVRDHEQAIRSALVFTRPQSPKSPDRDALANFVRGHASDERLTDAELGSLVRHHPLAKIDAVPSGSGERG